MVGGLLVAGQPTLNCRAASLAADQNGHKNDHYLMLSLFVTCFHRPRISGRIFHYRIPVVVAANYVTFGGFVWLTRRFHLGNEQHEKGM